MTSRFASRITSTMAGAFAALALLGATPVQAHAAGIPPASHAYGLNSTLDDELGGSPLIAHGGTVGKKTYVFDQGQGVSVMGALPAATYSIEMRFTPTSTNGYRRLIDFKDNLSDRGLYIHYGFAEFYNTGPGHDVVFHDGETANLVMTRNGKTREVVVYVNGGEQIRFIDADDDAVFIAGADGTHATFLMDDWHYAGEHTAGSLDHLRVFDKVLSAAAVKQLHKAKLPPNVTQK